MSPSSFGFQPFQVLVIRDKKLLEELTAVTWGGQKQFPTASEVLLFNIRKDVRFDSDYIDHCLKTVRNLPAEVIDIYKPLVKQHQEQDFKLLHDIRYLHDWAGKQIYIALGNLMSAAAEIGIDSCPIEGFSIETVTDILVKHDIIDPALQEPCVFCAIGYRAAPPARPKARRDINELIKFIDAENV
ncbi:MAG: nitroreductase family protein [Gammaproteobacteria bacterium]|nr:nitroreductase family protein [Gammaproteobacteria bacterium]